jgi:uncharacterized protein (TIGR00299 family) protein
MTEMKIAYLDCASGISGDMMLGALVDAGVELEEIQTAIDSLGLPGCRLVEETTRRQGFRARKVTVQADPEHAHRHLHHIVEIIDRGRLTPRQQELARQMFYRLAEVEAKVHGTSIQKVHFHEVGAVDSIADIVGTAVGWDLLGAQRLVCSPVPTGTGFVQIAHGRCAVPAPATAELLVGVPLAVSQVEAELTTPTGAAILATLVDQFGPMPSMVIERIGYGAGQRDLEQQPNVLRLCVGEQGGAAQEVDVIEVLETNLDNASGEVVAYCMERLWGAGALDVYTTAIQMKKGRPAVKLTVLCPPETADNQVQILLRETPTLGVRRWTTYRHKLPRVAHQVKTSWGSVAGKLIQQIDGSQRFAAEYESCRQLAQQSGQPLWRIVQAAESAGTAEAE